MRTLIVSLAAIAIPAVAQAVVVVPNDRANTPGTGVFLGPLSTAQRTYQLLIDESQLTTVVGHQLTGITWRLPSAATVNYPAADATYNSFDIRLSGGVDPSARSLTFANNVVGTQSLVRSGPLSVPLESFKVNPTAPHEFGMVIGFDSPYSYTGGDLLLELRHTGISGSTSSVDSVTTSTPGYGTLFSAAWTSSYTGVTGAQGNAVITQFTSVIPEPATLTIFAAMSFVTCMRRRRGA